ncbi:MAG: nucleotidyltransferase family protein [Planctomycetota bacterium]
MSWSLEEKIVLYASQLSVGGQHQRILETLLADRDAVDWNRLFKITVREGTAGLVYKTLKRMGGAYTSGIPCMEALARVYSSTVFQNTLLIEEFKHVLFTLESRHVPIIVLRGYALIYWIYKDPGLRPINDIDILIREKDLSLMKEVLSKAGFHSPAGHPLLSIKGKVVIDIHLDILGSSRIQSRRFGFDETAARWWEHCRDISSYINDEGGAAGQVSYRSVFVLKPHDFVITCAMHLMKHSFERLLWFVDIKEIIEHESPCFAWDGLADRARCLELQRPLYYALHYIKTLYGTDVPQLLMDDLKRACNTFDYLMIGILLENKKMPRWGDIAFLFNIKDTRQKIRYLRETYFPRREVMSQVFDFSNPFMVYFLYIFRAGQVIYAGSRGCMRLFLYSLALLCRNKKTRFPG